MIFGNTSIACPSVVVRIEKCYQRPMAGIMLILSISILGASHSDYILQWTNITGECGLSYGAGKPLTCDNVTRDYPFVCEKTQNRSGILYYTLK